MVAQSRFARSPTRTVEESKQLVDEFFVILGLFPQITIVVELKERKTQKSNINFLAGSCLMMPPVLHSGGLLEPDQQPPSSK